MRAVRRVEGVLRLRDRGVGRVEVSVEPMTALSEAIQSVA